MSCKFIRHHHHEPAFGTKITCSLRKESGPSGNLLIKGNNNQKIGMTPCFLGNTSKKIFGYHPIIYLFSVMFSSSRFGRRSSVFVRLGTGFNSPADLLLIIHLVCGLAFQIFSSLFTMLLIRQLFYLQNTEIYPVEQTQVNKRERKTPIET